MAQRSGPDAVHASTAWPLTLLYGALIVYASLFPFTGWRNQGIAPWAFLSESLPPRYWTGFDVLTNLAGYAPLGFLLTLALMRWSRGQRDAAPDVDAARNTALRWPLWPMPLLAALAVALLSLCLEAIQSYLPMRVASNLDLLMNATGACAGAALAYALERLGAIDQARRLRARWFARDSRGALVLLALWPVALLFPAPVAFGLGQVAERLHGALARALADTPWALYLPALPMHPHARAVEVACVALGVLAPCLLGYTAIVRPARRARFTALTLAAGCATSALSAALSYGPPYAGAWISEPVELGLLVAMFTALLLLSAPRRGCAALLLALLAAQVALLNAAPEGAYFAATHQGWEQGRFIHFYGLAQWVGWLWPYATFAYMAAWLARPRDSHVGFE